MHTDIRRKRNRMAGHDYSQTGYYFMTICVKGRTECLGEMKNEEIRLNKYGKLIEAQWLWLAKQYNYVELDEYIVMPNHIHGIIAINPELAESNQNTVGTGRDLSGRKTKNITQTPVGTGLDLSLRCDNRILSLSNLMGAFKTTSSKLIHENGLPDFAWQRSFYDHIIRSKTSLKNIRKYIFYNTAKWELDRNNPENLLM